MALALALAACAGEGIEAVSGSPARPADASGAGSPGTDAIGGFAASGGGAPTVSDDDADATVSPVPPAPMFDDEALRRLESRVATDVVDDRNHESWLCTGGTRRIEYRLAVEPDGTRRGDELDGGGLSASTTFGWAAIGADTLLFDYPDVGRQVELGAILFVDEDAFRANDAASGPLKCRRQRYVDGEPTLDVSVTVPEDVDRDVEAAAVLAGRIETPRIGDAFDYWYCEIAGERPIGYVFAADGVLGPGPRAVAFDPAPEGVEGRGDAGDGGVQRRPLVDPALVDGRRFRWLATDGTTLLLVPLDADVATHDDGVGTSSLEGIVFPVDTAFTARRADGALLQCLRDGDA